MIVYGLFTVIHCIQFSICFCLQFPNLFPLLSFPSFQLLLTRVSLAHLHLEWNYQSRSWLSPFKNFFISSTTAFGSFPFPSFSSTPLLSWILRFSILLSTLANIFPSYQVFSWHCPLIGLSLLCPVIPVEAITLLREESFKPWIWFLVAINLWSFSEESHKLMSFLGRPPGSILDHFPSLSVLDVIILTPQTL